MATYENRVNLEKEEYQRELAQKVMAATLDQLVSQIQGDMKLLEEQLPTKQMAAMETALDMKYVKDRQKFFAWIVNHEQCKVHFSFSKSEQYSFHNKKTKEGTTLCEGMDGDQLQVVNRF